jgi:hypothetical protein
MTAIATVKPSSTPAKSTTGPGSCGRPDSLVTQ